MLDLEISLQKSKEKVESLEKKLGEKTEDLLTTRKDRNFFKSQFEKLKSETDKPLIYSQSLTVS